MRDHGPEFFDFLSKFSNQLDVRVLVHVRLVDDVLGAIRIPTTKFSKVSAFTK